MPQDAKRLCRRYGLDYVETTDLRLRRRRCGRGFSYMDGEGRTLRDKALKARIKQLAIPPAWTEVCIAEDERAHIQAVGRDAEHRFNTATTPIGSRLAPRPKRADCSSLVRRSPIYAVACVRRCPHQG